MTVGVAVAVAKAVAVFFLFLFFFPVMLSAQVKISSGLLYVGFSKDYFLK